nr:YeeE/YedE family protein [Vicinamibacteria bacterium]
TEVYLVPTYWPAQIVGGLLLGAGFVIGGYCPGTSIAAVATGRIDGLIYVLGLTAGTLAFAVLFPRLEGFYTAGGAGELTLPQLLHLPRAVVVSGVVIIAMAGFSAASLIERRFGSRAEGGPQS